MLDALARPARRRAPPSQRWSDAHRPRPGASSARPRPPSRSGATEVAQPLLTAVALLSGRALLGRRRPDRRLRPQHRRAVGAGARRRPDRRRRRRPGRRPRRAHGAGRGRAPDDHGGRPRRRPSTRTTWPAAGLEVATVNVPGQVVVGGPVDALQAWTPPAGARVRPLDVAGAFHTSAMAPAVDGFRALVEAIDAQDAGLRRRRQRRRRGPARRPRAAGPPRRPAHPAGPLRPVPAGARRARAGPAAYELAPGRRAGRHGQARPAIPRHRPARPPPTCKVSA